MQIPQGHILLVADQGYSDAIQFARYIPQVAARCAGVVLGCSEPLAPLLAGIEGVDRLLRGTRMSRVTAKPIVA